MGGGEDVIKIKWQAKRGMENFGDRICENIKIACKKVIFSQFQGIPNTPILGSMTVSGTDQISMKYIYMLLKFYILLTYLQCNGYGTNCHIKWLFKSHNTLLLGKYNSIFNDMRCFNLSDKNHSSYRENTYQTDNGTISDEEHYYN